MNPEQLTKSGSEDGEQMALFCWARNMINSYPERYWMLEWLFAIPNGGSRGDSKQTAMIVGGRLKATGVKAGVADVMLPYAAHGLHGLFIEMKKSPMHGGSIKDASDKQMDFITAMRANGYGACVACGWIQAARVICQWIGIDQSEWPE